MKWIRELFLIIILLTVCIVVATYPAILHFSSKVIGTSGSVFSGDAYISSWMFWWASFASRQAGLTPLSTFYQFFPYTLEIIGELSPLYIFINRIVSHEFNFAEMYNIRVFLSFLITGITMYLCFRRTGNSIVGALSGMMVFTFSYYHVIRATQGHIDLASTEWYGLFLLSQFVVMIRGKARPVDIVIGSLGIALTGYTDYRNFSQLLHFATVSSFIYMCVVAVTKGAKDALRYLVFMGFVMLGAALLLLPLILYAFNHHPIGSIVGFVDPQFVPRWQALFLPPKSTILSWIITGTHVPTGWVPETKVVYLGVVPLMLSAIFLLGWRNRTAKHFFITVVISAALYFCLLFFGWDKLYEFLYPLYVFRPLIITSRLIILLNLCLSVLVAATVTTLENNLPSFRRILLWIVPFMVFIETLIVPISLIDASSPPEISLLKARSSGTVLELPLSFRDINKVLGGADNNVQFFHQIAHEKPIMGGYMAIIDTSIWKKLDADSLIKKIIQCQEEDLCSPLTSVERMRFISYYKVRYFIVPKNWDDSNIAALLFTSFLWKQIAEGDGYQTYELVSEDI